MVPILLATLLSQTPAEQTCSGAEPAITSVATERVVPDGAVNDYQLLISVTNRGDVSQRGNTLQSVDIYQDGTKVDQKGIPPLKAGDTYSFTYPYVRNADAAAGTTNFTFRLVGQQGDLERCGDQGGEYAYTV